MATTTKFYLDTRAPRQDGTCLLKLVIHRNGKAVQINMGVYLKPSQWDKRSQQITAHPAKLNLNNFLTRRRADIETALLRLSESPDYYLTPLPAVRDMVLNELNPKEEPSAGSFTEWFSKFKATKKESTRGVYEQTWAHIRKFRPHDFEALTFEDINQEWLLSFDAYLSKTSPSRNARNIHLRNIRAVFNFALDAEATACYPFRRFKIRPEATRKRSLPTEELRRLFDYPVEEWQRFYLDMFKLIFALIGINCVDLHQLKRITPDGRIEYKRAKTGRLYSIKVEPEAVEIIERWQGKKGLLAIADRWTDHSQFRHQINSALQSIGEVSRSGRGGKKTVQAEWPELTTYWARHSWATIAASLDIPKETIAHALGHGGNSTTDIYIDFDMRKVDEANRRVLDWVLYGKRE